MKIIGIGRNYAKHIKEMGNKSSTDPVVFLKPDSAVLRNNDPFYFPDYTQEIHYEVELVLKISKVGKNIEENFAHNYYQEIALGIDFTARDLQSRFKKEGLPWTLAKGFNGSAPISDFFPKNHFGSISALEFSLKKNGKIVQSGNSADMIHSFDELIAFCSIYMTLKKGDLIFTGTPEGVGPIKIGDRLSGYISNHQVMEFEIR